MPAEWLFDVDPETGTREFFTYNDDSDSFTIRTEQDVTALIEANKTIANGAREDWKGDLHRVASIPLSLLPELEKLGIMTAGGRVLDQAALRKWLNDPDHRFFRTRPGRV